MNIPVITRSDDNFPEQLKQRLGARCPAQLYYAGNLKLAEQNYIGFVGSRCIDENGKQFTKNTVHKINQLGFGVVSGGAQGVDHIAGITSIQNGKTCIHFVAHSLSKLLKSPEILAAVENDQLLLLSDVHPDSAFKASAALRRNRYIYAQSKGTIVVRADYRKGGTWSGAVYCLKHDISPIFCWKNQDYTGNMELISRGCIPIDENYMFEKEQCIHAENCESSRLYGES